MLKSITLLVSMASMCVGTSINQQSYFLPKLYASPERVYRVRQIPGDGSCLFNTIAYCLHSQNNENCEFTNDIFDLAARLRSSAVDILEHPNITVYVDRSSQATIGTLLDYVCKMYNTTPEAYCAEMRKQETWGGGPEIIALANMLQRPIHIYELTHRKLFPRDFTLKCTAQVGSPLFDAKSPLEILCADGRFPHIRPGQQKMSGDHFLALVRTPHHVAHPWRGMFWRRWRSKE